MYRESEWGRIRDEHEASAEPTRIRRGREGRPRWHQELDGLQEPEREGVPAPPAVLTRQTEAASGLSSTASRLGLTVGLCWHFLSPVRENRRNHRQKN